MADKALDTLYIAYKSSGIDKVRKDLREVLASVKETQRKINALLRGMESPFKRIESASLAVGKIHSRFAKQLESATANYKAQEKSLRQISNLTKGLKGAKITVKYETPKTTATETGTTETGDLDRGSTGRNDNTTSAHTARNDSFPTLVSVLKAYAIPAVFVKAVDSFVKQNNEIRKANQQFYNAIKLSGLSGRAATNAAVNIQRYGGDAGDVLASSNSISASLGALSRGDTSLVEHLARFGIGGIMPNMTPAQVQNIIKRRLSSGQLNANEVNALFAGLPYSNAEKISMLEGNDLYKGNLKAFQVEEENRNALYEGARAQIKLAEKFEGFLASPYITNGESFYQKMKDEYPALFAGIQFLNNILAELSPILTSLTSLTSIFGAGGAFGLAVKALSKMTGTASLAAGTFFLVYEGTKKILEYFNWEEKSGSWLYNQLRKPGEWLREGVVDRRKNYLESLKKLTPKEAEELKLLNMGEEDVWALRYGRHLFLDTSGKDATAPKTSEPTAMNVTINVGSMEEAFNVMADLQQRGIYNLNFMESALV